MINLKISKMIDSWLETKVGFENFKPGLDRLFPIFGSNLKKLSEIPVVTVAGTNGKGECAFALYHLAKGHGIKAALWTSPHLISVKERFNFSNFEMSEMELFQFFKETLNSLKKENGHV